MKYVTQLTSLAVRRVNSGDINLDARCKLCAFCAGRKWRQRHRSNRR